MYSIINEKLFICTWPTANSANVFTKFISVFFFWFQVFKITTYNIPVLLCLILLLILNCFLENTKNGRYFWKWIKLFCTNWRKRTHFRCPTLANHINVMLSKKKGIKRARRYHFFTEIMNTISHETWNLSVINGDLSYHLVSTSSGQFKSWWGSYRHALCVMIWISLYYGSCQYDPLPLCPFCD